MLIDLKFIIKKYNLNIKGILHIGLSGRGGVGGEIGRTVIHHSCWSAL